MAVSVPLPRIIRNFFAFFLPGGLVYIASLVCIRQGIVYPWLPQVLELAPYVILGIGFLLGWRFHRSRLVYMILILTLAERILYYFGPGGVTGFGGEEAVFTVTAILLPLNLTLFYFITERGLFNLRGLLKLLFILAQPLGFYYLFIRKPHLFNYLNREFINLPSLESVHLPQAVLLTNGVLILAFFLASLLSSKPVQRGFFWSLLAIVSAFHGIANNISGASVFFSVAGVIIILSMIEVAYSMAYRDDLTGLPARRALNNTMQSLGRRYTIAMLDIDFFKKFNDRHGHDVGDQVLCMVASHIGRVGGGGKAFRYGGEEFTVVFPGKSREDVTPHLERVRESIADAQFGLRSRIRPKKKPKKRKKTKSPRKVSVTISIGVAESGPKFNTPTKVIKAADQALYRAKRKGRNRVAT